MILLLEQIHLATTLDTCKDSPLLKTPQPVNAVLACAKGGQMHVSYIFLALTCMPSGTVPPSVILWVKFLCLFSWISFVTPVLIFQWWEPFKFHLQSFCLYRWRDLHILGITLAQMLEQPFHFPWDSSSLTNSRNSCSAYFTLKRPLQW